MTVFKTHPNMVDVDVFGGNIIEIVNDYYGGIAFALTNNGRLLKFDQNGSQAFEAYDEESYGGAFGLQFGVNYGFGYQNTLVFVDSNNIYYLDIDNPLATVEVFALNDVNLTISATMSQYGDESIEFGVLIFDNVYGGYKFSQISYGSAPEIGATFNVSLDYTNISYSKQIGDNFLMYDSVNSNWRLLNFDFYNGINLLDFVFPDGITVSQHVRSFANAPASVGSYNIIFDADTSTVYFWREEVVSTVVQAYFDSGLGGIQFFCRNNDEFDEIQAVVRYVATEGTNADVVLSSFNFEFVDTEMGTEISGYVMENDTAIATIDLGVPSNRVNCVAPFGLSI